MGSEMCIRDRFDRSPTGLINGKNETEVDFSYKDADNSKLGTAMFNMRYIDKMLEGTNYDW